MTVFIYRVNVAVSLTGQDLASIARVCDRHYDGTVRSAATVGGFIRGALVSFYFLHRTDEDTATRPDCDEEEGYRRFAEEHSELVTEEVWTSRQLDLLCKALEMAQTAHEVALFMRLSRLLAELREEFSRLNTRT